MDSLRGFEDEAAMPGSRHDDEPDIERPPSIGVDERRMHVRAYNYWVSLLRGRPYPSIEDLDPHSLEDFGPNSVLLDFSRDAEDPEIAFLGRALRGECGLDHAIRRISEVPSRSLLSRLTDHYLQIIANRSPIGFEAEFQGQRGHNTLYRGILMPLSSNGEVIDFIYGVINWKELADSETADGLADEVNGAIAAAPPAADCAVWADGPNGAHDHPEPEPVEVQDESAPTLWAEPEQPELPAVAADAGLADRLDVARQWAEQVLSSEQRSRSALYQALSLAFDFALAADEDPEGFAELLEDAGITIQARAPMTPVVKLVFGAGYDKARLTEFAAALCWARREGVAQGGLAERLEGFPGGLKGIVRAERQARRPGPRADRWDEIRRQLLGRPPLASVDVSADVAEGEFVLLLARREAGRLAIVSPIADPGLVERAIRKSA